MQFVEVNNVRSDTEFVPYGVPQGSALGPILFILFINDLPKAITNGELRLFADDANHFLKNKNANLLQAEAQSQFQNIAKWMNANKLTINYSKTNFTVFSPSTKINIQQMFTGIKFGQHNIQRVESIKYLGIIIDDKLTWKNHVESIRNKLKRLSSIFYKVRLKMPPFCLKQVYFALVHAALQYGVEIYANCKKTYLGDLITMNNRILRILQFKNTRTRNIDLYEAYNVIPVDGLHEYRLCLFMYKYVHCSELLPISFRNYFTFNLDMHAYNTRISSQLHVQRFNTSFGKRALHYHLATIWNRLPTSLKTLPTLHKFKKGLINHLRDEAPM
jgi:hypothetical protein